MRRVAQSKSKELNSSAYLCVLRASAVVSLNVSLLLTPIKKRSALNTHYAMKPRSWFARLKLARFGNTVNASLADTPNHFASVAPS